MVFILRETGLLYYNGVSTESNKKSTAMVIAHELAHMWFGNLVTLQWWDYTWLNEGFARLFQYLATNTVSSITFVIKLHGIITMFMTTAIILAVHQIICFINVTNRLNVTGVSWSSL
jgi:Aminopeptidase N